MKIYRLFCFLYIFKLNNKNVLAHFTVNFMLVIYCVFIFPICSKEFKDICHSFSNISMVSYIRDSSSRSFRHLLCNKYYHNLDQNYLNVITGGKDEGTVRFLFVLEIIYFVIYWLIYLLSWVIIPIAQEYERAADFTSKDRLKRAVKTNIIFYVFLLVIGLIFVLYLIIKQQLTG